MSWWKKIMKEALGGSEVRKHDDYEDINESCVSTSTYDLSKDENPPPVVVEEVAEWVEPDEEKPEYKDIPALNLAKVSFQASPNKSARKGAVKYLVIHHTGPGSFNGIVNWLCNKDAKASAHYVIGTTGQLKQLVNTKYEAWHAGVAECDGVKINNHHSIGIELCNIGVMEKDSDGKYYYSVGRSTKRYTGKVDPEYGEIITGGGNEICGYDVPYPEKQIDKLVALCKGIVKKYPAITRDNVLTHCEIALPDGRKNDPFGLDMEMLKDRIFG